MIWLWVGFLAFVFVMLALDLFVVNRKAHVVSAKEALRFTGVTVVLALAFSGTVYWMYLTNFQGIDATIRQELIDAAVQKDAAATDFVPAAGDIARTATLKYLTAWIIEYALSLDNIFVIAVIFQFFRIPAMYQHRVLFWGILGALVMRGAMIGAGAALVHTFDWILYVFGAILLWTAWKMLRAGHEDINPEKSFVVRTARKVYPVSAELEGERFFTRIDGRRAITPLFLVLLVVESTDVVFAVDSIPAVLAITHDPFLVFTSNVFAILGLRSLYFALSALMGKFEYLKVSLAFVLAFVGVKMLIHKFVNIPTELSLGVIVVALASGVVASLVADRRKAAPGGPPASPTPPAAH
jgi:tellurite resistance protein TerC